MRRNLKETIYCNCFIATFYVLIKKRRRFKKIMFVIHKKKPHMLLETKQNNIFHFRTTDKRECIAPLCRELRGEMFRKHELFKKRKTWEFNL